MVYGPIVCSAWLVAIAWEDHQASVQWERTLARLGPLRVCYAPLATPQLQQEELTARYVERTRIMC